MLLNCALRQKKKKINKSTESKIVYKNLTNVILILLLAWQSN